jgi:hypothetical protein
MGQAESRVNNDKGMAVLKTYDGIETLNDRYQKETSPGVFGKTYKRNQQNSKFPSKSGKLLFGTLIGLGICSILVQSVVLFVIHE